MKSVWKCITLLSLLVYERKLLQKDLIFLFFFFSLQKVLNDALMGILRVRDLTSPPYISTDPSLNVHKISDSDQFVIVGSDGLFDFFSNDEAVQLVESYILRNPFGDPAKFLIELLVARAADSAGHFSRSRAKFDLHCMHEYEFI